MDGPLFKQLNLTEYNQQSLISLICLDMHTFIISDVAFYPYRHPYGQI